MLKTSFGLNSFVIDPSAITVRYTIQFEDEGESASSLVFYRNLDGSYSAKDCWKSLLSKETEITIKNIKDLDQFDGRN